MSFRRPPVRFDEVARREEEPTTQSGRPAVLATRDLHKGQETRPSRTRPAAGARAVAHNTDGGVGALPRKEFRYDHQEVTVKPLDATRRSSSAGLNRLARRLLISALVLFALSGCSLAFVDGPSSTPSPSGNACTTSYAAPTLDLLGVPATFVLGFGFGGFERSLEAIAPDDDDTFGNLEKASLAASGALLVSSVYGLVQVGRCRASREAGAGPPLLPSRLGDRFLGTVPDRRGPAGRRLYTPVRPDFGGMQRSPALW